MWPFSRKRTASPEPEPGAEQLPWFEHRAGSTRLALRCRASLEPYAKLALRGLAQRVEQGVHVAAGQTYDFGGMLFSLREDDGRLLISRPLDPRGQAFLGEGDDLSDMLGIVAMQIDLTKRLGVEPVPYTLFDRLIVEEGMHDTRSVYMHRTAAASPGDSGWFIATHAYREGNPLCSIQVLQLFRVRPSLLWAFILPTEHLAFFDGNDLIRVVDPSNRELELGRGG